MLYTLGYNRIFVLQSFPRPTQSRSQGLSEMVYIRMKSLRGCLLGLDFLSILFFLTLLLLLLIRLF